MINDLINSIKVMLIDKFPNIKVYVSKSDKEFTRPSFFIRYFYSKQTDLNRNTYLNNITIKVIYFAPLDEYMNIDLMAQNEIWDTMRNIFSSGYIKVLDRAVKINSLRGRYKDTEIHLKINLDFIQDRIFNTPESPKAETINLKF